MGEVLGIDIGGTGIKSAIVDIRNGKLISERIRIPTPSNSSPNNILEVLHYIIERLDYNGPIGIGFPGPVKNGLIYRAINLNEEWDDLDARTFFSKAVNRSVHLINDADAAALSEYRFGNWPSNSKTVIFLTVGTGIGSSIWVGDRLLPNSELGHLRVRRKLKFEEYASNKVRKEKELSWKKWGFRFNRILQDLDFYFSQPAFIIGGGIASKKERFAPYIEENITWDTAKLENEAGIIGAAIYAAK